MKKNFYPPKHPALLFYIFFLGVICADFGSLAFAIENKTGVGTLKKPGIPFHQNLEKNIREEIKIINDFTVEVDLGSDGKSVSSSILDAIRSIPVVGKGREPAKASIGKAVIYKQKNGSYTWDMKGDKPVKMTSAFIKNAGGKIKISIENKSAQMETAMSPESVTATQGTADIQGFRSARFGMKEKEVRSAIQKDFKIGKAKIEQGENPIEKTTFLAATVDNLLPESGPGRLVYIFGYQSKKLIQVNIVWGKPANPKPKVEGLVSTANLLRNYFIKLGFPQDKVVMNTPLGENSILVFRGIDKKGKMVNLILNNPQNEENPGTDASLMIFYVADPDTPDVFSLKKGMF